MPPPKLTSLSCRHSEMRTRRPATSFRTRCNMLTTRRQTLGLFGGLFAAGIAAPAFGQTAGMSRVTAYAFSFPALKGGDIRLADFAGKPILVVNTASQCGYTPQYTGLQQLWTRFHERGLMIIGVPSNDFGGQEPGSFPSSLCRQGGGVVPDGGRDIAGGGRGRHDKGGRRRL